MTTRMRWNWLLLALTAIVALLMAYAWIDGGREPVHPITKSVPVPGSAR